MLGLNVIVMSPGRRARIRVGCGSSSGEEACCGRGTKGRAFRP